MTPTFNLTAKQQLNRDIAVKVFGLKVCDSPAGMTIEHGTCSLFGDQAHLSPDSVDHYVTDDPDDGWGGMQAIIRRMESLGFRWECGKIPDGYHAHFFGDRRGYGSSTNITEAVGLAAVNAVTVAEAA